jgi:hypothetical protein
MRNIKFVPHSSFQENGRSSVSLVRKLSMLEERGSSILFPSRREWACERNTTYLSVFSWVMNITFGHNGHIQVNGRRTLSLVRTLPMLEAGGSNTLFPCENGVNMWKECLGTKSVLKWHCLKNTRIRWIRETPVAHGTVQCVRDRIVFHLFSPWELIYLQKGILPTTESFHVGGTSPLFQIAAFKCIQRNAQSTISRLRTPLMSEGSVSSTLFRC